MSFDPQHVLASDGPIARRLGGNYEPRPQQAAMVEAVGAALAKGEKLLVEAGTGVGKSFAYLLPAIAAVVGPMNDPKVQAGSYRRRRIVISTHTIALQEQLMQKDIPLLQAVLGEEFSAVLVKGRGNYLSLRRLAGASQKQHVLFPDPVAMQSLHAIEDWAYKTEDGTLATLPALSRPSVWDKVQSDAGNCMGKRCPTYGKCFYQNARRRMENADLLVTNHALFFADLALRQQGVSILPPYDHVILDEAHTIEDVASEHFGLRFSEGQVRFLLSGLYQPRTGKGFLATLSGSADEDLLTKASHLVGDAEQATNDLFDELLEYQETRGRKNGRISEPDVVGNPLSPVLMQLSLALKMVRDHTEVEADKFEISGYIGRCEAAAAACQALIAQTMADSVYWLEVGQGGRDGTRRNVSMYCSPIDVGPLLRERLFHAENEHKEPIGVVLTSATMATGAGKGFGVQGSGFGVAEADANPFDMRSARPRIEPKVLPHSTSSHSPQPEPRTPEPQSPNPEPRTLNPSSPAFRHIQRRLGCDDASTLQLGSPFDYESQAELIVETDLPEPNSPVYFEQLCPRVLHHLERSDGGAFVLFTSFELLRRVAQWLRPHLGKRGMPLLVHGDGEQRSALLERFRGDRRSVLLGADSFWQGVDVRGQALRNVIITKLPFAVPDRPLIEARMQRIEARGGNSFAEYSLPEAILKFKQGFGRLIRSKTDRGTVVVLDSRVAKKSYGRQFIAALPKLPVTRVRG